MDMGGYLAFSKYYGKFRLFHLFVYTFIYLSIIYVNHVIRNNNFVQAFFR